ncbi:MAG: NADH-quinone oxidoreductase subunit N [Armatimonadota bacterium]|nr:NADH-quinone oxidoreductase subunit N [Armatimonadota bacterium]
MNRLDGAAMAIDGAAIAPEVALWVFACIALLIEWLAPRNGEGKQSRWLSAEAAATAGLVIALACLLLFPGNERLAFNSAIVVDPLSHFYRALCILTSLILIPSSWRYMQGRPNRPEFYALLLLATSGMTLMVESNDLIMLFLAIEFLSITSYVLVGYLKGNRRSTEGSIKYFLFGSVCSALMLYGMSLLYGLTGTTKFDLIQRFLRQYPLSQSMSIPSGLEVLMVVTFFAGIGFKISMWPFHMWAPDAYEGAPTPVTAFLSVGPKLAGIAVFVRVAEGLLHSEQIWPALLGLVAVVTMTWGNLAALTQTNLKRMLAYSSIAQAGYLLVGVMALAIAPAPGDPNTFASNNSILLQQGLSYAYPAVLIYSLAYLVMNLGAFIVAIEVERESGTSDVAGFAGLGERSPGMAAAMTVFLLGLGGIPLTAGFIGKLYLFGSAVAWAVYGRNPILWIVAGFGAANSVVSIYYYFRVLQPMWLASSPAPAVERTSWGTPGILAAGLAILTLLLGIFGQALITPASGFDVVHTGMLMHSPASPALFHGSPPKVIPAQFTFSPRSS